MHHDVKQYDGNFQDIVDNKQRAMNRFNDRNYQVDDSATLFEGHDSLEGYQYSGRTISVRFSHIDTYGCQDGFVNLSLSNVGMLVVRDKVPG